MVSAEDLQMMKDLRAEGRTYQTIAEETGWSLATVYRHMNGLDKVRYADRERKAYTITNKMVNQMMMMRQNGAKYREIAKEMGVSITTVARYVCPLSNARQRKHEKDRYHRMKQDPVAMAKKRERIRAYLRNLRGNNAEADT